MRYSTSGCSAGTGSRPCCLRYASIARCVFAPARPSITPDENPARSSATCSASAWWPCRPQRRHSGWRRGLQDNARALPARRNWSSIPLWSVGEQMTCPRRLAPQAVFQLFVGRFLLFSGRELGELLINSGNRLLEHPAVGRRRRTVEVGDGARARELERGAAFGDRALLGASATACRTRSREASSCCASTAFDSQPRAMMFT